MKGLKHRRIKPKGHYFVKRKKRNEEEGGEIRVTINWNCGCSTLKRITERGNGKWEFGRKGAIEQRKSMNGTVFSENWDNRRRKCEK